MATYVELHDLYNNSVLQHRIEVAIAVASESIRSEVDTTPNHAARVAWAKAALFNLQSEARRCMLIALAQNKANTTTQITNASDATLQTAVDSAVNLLI